MVIKYRRLRAYKERGAHEAGLLTSDPLLSITSTTFATMPTGSLDHRLANLSHHLSALPKQLSDHPSVYPFCNFTLSDHDIEHYGTPQGALNHQFGLIFGSRLDNRPVQFRGRGPSLLAVIDVLDRYISGETEENILLWKWVDDLTHGAVECAKTVGGFTTYSVLYIPINPKPRYLLLNPGLVPLHESGVHL